VGFSGPPSLGFQVPFRYLSSSGMEERMADPRQTNFEELIPELPLWNNGAGIDAEGWAQCMGNYELFVGYTLLLWPQFVKFDGYVLREGFSEESLRGFEREPYDPADKRRSIEAVMNHEHLDAFHFGKDCKEVQLRYLGRTMKQMHEVKLAHDFPDLKFEVFFNDEPGLELDEYQLTFWQV
jgi:hypothetical protein